MSQKSKKSVFKPGPLPPPSNKHTLENWGEWGKETPPKPGEIKMFAGFQNGPASSLGQGATGALDHEKEDAEALKDPEFAKLCKQMGITPTDAVRFHKLAKG